MFAASVDIQIWIQVVDVCMSYWLIAELVKTSGIPSTQKNVSRFVSGLNENKPAATVMLHSKKE